MEFRYQIPIRFILINYDYLEKKINSNSFGMDKDLLKQNQTLKAKIANLQQQINSLIVKQNRHLQVQSVNFLPQITNDSTLIQQNKCPSEIDFSPIQTCDSLQQQITCIGMKQMKQKSKKEHLSSSELNESRVKISVSEKPLKIVKFNIEDRMDLESNVTNSDISKQLQTRQHNLKKSIESIPQMQQMKQKNFYNSAIKQKNHCEECIIKMHQLHEMQFLKNKYHREYITLRTELQKVKLQIHQNQSHHTARSSINLIEIYGEHNNQEKSQKSSFSFENIQNALLSQRFALEIQQCIKLIDKLLPIDRKFIELSSADCKLLMELQLKIENLKFHLGLDTEPKFLEDLFNQLQKSDLTIKKIHEKYRKLFEKAVKTHKQKLKRSKDQFNQVNQVIVVLLKDLHDTKIKNQKLSAEIDMVRFHSFDGKDTKSQLLGSSHQLKISKETANNQILVSKQKELHQTSSSQLQKSSSFSESKIQKQVQKYQLKLKNNQKQNKTLQKINKQLKVQLSAIKKKSLNDFNQFMNAIIFNSYSKIRNTSQQTDLPENQNQTQLQNSIQTQLQNSIQNRQNIKKRQSESKILDQLSNKNLIQQVGTLVYEIFSFTSWESEEDNNIFCPQSQQQIVEMLMHIKKFTSKFDEWQKEKERQINGFQRNFLQLLKFFIDNYKVSETKLIEEVSTMKDSQSLIIYIKKYYSKSIQSNDAEDRVSSSFTFGQKSESCKDSEVQY